MKASAILLMALVLSGCVYPPMGTSGRSFWDQRIRVTAWGINMVTMYGPITIGYVSWQRNDEDFKPVSPGLPAMPLDQPLR